MRSGRNRRRGGRRASSAALRTLVVFLVAAAAAEADVVLAAPTLHTVVDELGAVVRMELAQSEGHRHGDAVARENNACSPIVMSFRSTGRRSTW